MPIARANRDIRCPEDARGALDFGVAGAAVVALAVLAVQLTCTATFLVTSSHGSDDGTSTLRLLCVYVSACLSVSVYVCPCVSMCVGGCCVCVRARESERKRAMFVCVFVCKGDTDKEEREQESDGKRAKEDARKDK